MTPPLPPRQTSRVTTLALVRARRARDIGATAGSTGPAKSDGAVVHVADAARARTAGAPPPTAPVAGVFRATQAAVGRPRRGARTADGGAPDVVLEVAGQGRGHARRAGDHRGPAHPVETADDPVVVNG